MTVTDKLQGEECSEAVRKLHYFLSSKPAWV